MKDSLKVPKILSQESYLKNMLALQLRELSWKDFKKLKDVNFKQIIEKLIESQKKRKMCHFCQQKSWLIGVKIGKDFLDRISRDEKPVSFRWRHFCSEKCLQNYIVRGHDKELKQFTKG